MLVVLVVLVCYTMWCAFIKMLCMMALQHTCRPSCSMNDSSLAVTSSTSTVSESLVAVCDRRFVFVRP